ncbi:MAG: TlpA disulfide reductase family protein [Candidatus Acidiferrales bacterium]
MKKMNWGVLFLSVLTLGTLNFSGCKGKTEFSTTSSADGGKTASKPLAAAPDVTFKDLQGKSETLASYQGKVVFVNFWATWCEPCQMEIPWLIELQKKYGDKGFTMLGVAMDEEGSSVVAPFVQKTEYDVDGGQSTMNYPIVLGNDDIADKFGGLLGYPTSFLVSRDGKILKKYLGPVSEPALDKQIQAALGSS